MAPNAVVLEMRDERTASPLGADAEAVVSKGLTDPSGLCGQVATALEFFVQIFIKLGKDFCNVAWVMLQLSISAPYSTDTLPSRLFL